MDTVQPNGIKGPFLKAFMGGMFWTTGATFLIKACGVLYTVVLLRYLGLHEYGTYQLVLAVYGMAGILLLQGIESLIIAQGAGDIGAGDTEASRRLGAGYFTLEMTASAVIWIITVVGGPYLTKFYSADVLSFFRLLAGIFLMLPLEKLVQYDLSIRKRFARLNLYGLIREMLQLGGGMLAVIYLPDKVQGLVLTSLVAYVIALLLFVPECVRRGYFSWSRMREGVRDVFRLVGLHGPWLVLQKVFRQFEKNIRPIFVQFFLGREAVALFGLADKLLTHVMSLFPATDVLVPLFASIKADHGRLQRVLRLGVKYSVPFYAALSLICYLAFPPLLRFAFPQYLPALKLFDVMLFYVPMTGVAYLMTSFFLSSQEQKSLSILTIGRTLFVVVVAPLCIKTFGLMGTVYEYALTLYVFILARYWCLVILHPALKLNLRILFRWDAEDAMIFRQICRRIVERALRALRSTSSV